jgi:hypothetical protein
MTGECRPWEYLVLAENHAVEKTALLLHRDPDEVRKTMESVYEGNFPSWYRRNRCPGSPDDPRAAWRLAKKIVREDFPRLFEQEGELLWPVVRVLEYCFRSFRPDAGPQTRPVQLRFLSRFRYYLKLYLIEAAKRRRKREAKRPPVRLLREEAWERLSQTLVETAEDQYATWQAVLYREVLLRLDPRTCTYLELRLAGMSVADIARRLGVSAKTTSNLFGKKRLVKRMQRAVAHIVLGLPAEDRNSVVRFFLDEEGFSVEQVERLLCVPYERLVNGPVAYGRGLEPEEVRELLGGERRLARPA